MKASHRRCSLLLFVYSDSYYGRVRTEVKTNQMGYIMVIARVARDLWQRKQILSSGFALGLSSFSAINPWHPCNNYYILLAVFCDWLSGDHRYTYMIMLSRIRWHLVTNVVTHATGYSSVGRARGPGNRGGRLHAELR